MSDLLAIVLMFGTGIFLGYHQALLARQLKRLIRAFTEFKKEDTPTEEPQSILVEPGIDEVARREHQERLRRLNER